MRCRDCFDDSLSADLIARRATGVRFERTSQFPSSIVVLFECPHGGRTHHMSHPGTPDFDWASAGLRRQEQTLADSVRAPDMSSGTAQAAAP